ncbi:hypothetical protein BGX29_003868, partial [Mortierella sp. GBA35]
MAHKRRRLEDKGWDPATTALVLDSPREKCKQKGCRLEGHEIMVSYHKDESVLHRPLIRDIRFPKTPVTSQTISNHIAAITDLLGLPPNKTRPKTRAIGPTEAIKKGALVDDM